MTIPRNIAELAARRFAGAMETGADTVAGDA
jgi:hypothetical protein